MRIGVGLGSQLGVQVHELVALAGPAVEVGFDSIWTNERSEPDAFELTSRWAEATPDATDVAVAVGVLPVPRAGAPGTVAARAAQARLRSGGRFVLGVGTGGYGPSFWESVGLPDRPVAVMADYLQYLRAALEDGARSFQGKTFSVADEEIARGPAGVPLYLAALGPQMLRLAGGSADGVLMNWASPELIDESRRRLEEGAAAAGRPPGQVCLAMYLRCVVDEDVDAARRLMAAELLRKIAPRDERGYRASLGYRAQFVRLGFEEAVDELEEQFEAGARAEDLLDDVPDDMCRAAGCYGTADDVAALVAEHARGLDEVILRPHLVRPGADAAVGALRALAPERVRAAQRALERRS